MIPALSSGYFQIRREHPFPDFQETATNKKGKRRAASLSPLHEPGVRG